MRVCSKSAYDELSRLTDETSDFTDTLSSDPGGHYHFHYTYGLSGLAAVTDAFGATLGYSHDIAGQTTAIGSGTDPTTYASEFVYCAWGAVKSMSYGNGKTMTESFNQRLQPTEFEIPGVIHDEHEYGADGRLGFSRDHHA